MNAPRRAIDWNSVKRRLAAIDDRLARTWGDAEELAAIYCKRAERLARRRSGTSTSGGGESALIFGYGGQFAVIKLSQLRGVARMPFCTPMPGSQPELCGIINHGGALRRVWDLARLLNSGSVGQDSLREASAGYLLTLVAGEQPYHVRVDSVERIVQIDQDAAAPRSDPIANDVGATVDVQLGDVLPDGLILVDASAVALRLRFIQQGASAPALTDHQGSCQCDSA